MLDQHAIDERRISIEDANLKVAYKPGVWQCHYCVKRFGSETVFMRHACKQKKRALEIGSPMGQAAFSYFTHWLKIRKFKGQTIDAFVESKYYRSFLRFATIVVTAGISKPERYIQLMHEANGITPDLWCREACYRIYLDWMDKQEDPFDQVKSSIECLMDLAERDGVDYRKIIEHLGSQKILSLITQRRLSPWFLLHSSVIQKMLRGLEKEEQHNFGRAINISAWIDRLQEQSELRDDIRHIISEVGL